MANLHYSCFNIQQSKFNNLAESTRAFKAHYILDDDKSKGVELSNSLDEALALRESMLENATNAYKQRTKQRPQFKKEKLFWSAVVLIKPETTMQDLENLSKHFKEKYGWQNYHIAIHRDEGHIDKATNEVKYNLHAHLEFLMLNEQGITCFKRSEFGKSKMREIQTEVAQILGMIRGQDKRETKAERLNHRQYRQHSRHAEKQRISFNNMLKNQYVHKDDVQVMVKKEVNERIEQERKLWITHGGHTKDDYAELRKLKEQEYKDHSELEKELAELRERLKNAQKDTKVIESLTEQVKTLKMENTTLKQENTILRAMKDRFVTAMTDLRGVSPNFWNKMTEMLGGLKIHSNKIHNPEILTSIVNKGISRK